MNPTTVFLDHRIAQAITNHASKETLEYLDELRVKGVKRVNIYKIQDCEYIEPVRKTPFRKVTHA